MPDRIHPKPVSLAEIFIKFSTDEECLNYLQGMRWPDGIVRCPTCGDKNITKYERPASPARKTRSETRDEKKTNRRAWFYICLNADCRQQFSPTSGTLFADSHLPLITWFHAIALMLNAKKGLSAKQLQRDLGIGGYKTAWYLNHRIREAMNEGDIPLLGGIVEIDETYIGGKTIRRKDRGNLRQKEAVVGMVERGGRIRFRHVGKGNVTAAQITPLVQKHVSPDAQIMTDQSTIYPYGIPKEQLAKHSTINHSREYARYVDGVCISTNTVESAFSLLKRGIIGSFHKVSIKHLGRYLSEFEYRFNRRNDADAFTETVRRLCGFKPLRFADLTSDPETASVPF